MATGQGEATNNVLSGEERRQIMHQKLKVSIDDDAMTRIKREST